MAEYGAAVIAPILQTVTSPERAEPTRHRQTLNEGNICATFNRNLEQLKEAQAADLQQKELLITNTHNLKRKLVDMEQECERYKASLTASEAKAKLEVESARLESLRARQDAQQEASAAKKETEAAKHEVEEAKQEIQRMKQEVEQLKPQLGLGQKSKAEWEELKKAFQSFQSNVDMQI